MTVQPVKTPASKLQLSQVSTHSPASQVALPEQTTPAFSPSHSVAPQKSGSVAGSTQASPQARNSHGLPVEDELSPVLVGAVVEVSLEPPSPDDEVSAGVSLVLDEPPVVGSAVVEPVVDSVVAAVGSTVSPPVEASLSSLPLVEVGEVSSEGQPAKSTAAERVSQVRIPSFVTSPTRGRRPKEEPISGEETRDPLGEFVL